MNDGLQATESWLGNLANATDATDAPRLRCLTWQPNSSNVPVVPLRAVLAVAHGLGEHAGRYQRLAERCAPHGIALIAIDFRGHGKSSGEACMVEHFADYCADLRALMLEARTLAKQGGADNNASAKPVPPSPVPLFLMGHSMGGAVALRFLSLYPEWRGAIKGLVLSSAALKIGKDVSPLLLKLAPLVARFAPRLRIQAIDPTLISRDQAEVAAYINDPLVAHRPAPTRTGNEVLQIIPINRMVARGLTMPLYVFHGDADRLTDVEGSRDIFGIWGGEDKTLRIWPGSQHETLNDLDGLAVASELIDWLVKHC